MIAEQEKAIRKDSVGTATGMAPRSSACLENNQHLLSVLFKAGALTDLVAGIDSGDSMDPFRVGRVA